MTLDFYQCDSFVSKLFKGNPAGFVIMSVLLLYQMNS